MSILHHIATLPSFANVVSVIAGKVPNDALTRGQVKERTLGTLPGATTAAEVGAGSLRAPAPGPIVTPSDTNGWCHDTFNATGTDSSTTVFAYRPGG